MSESTIPTPADMAQHGCDRETMDTALAAALKDASFVDGSYYLSVHNIETAIAAQLKGKARALALELLEARGWIAHYVGAPGAREQIVCRP